MDKIIMYADTKKALFIKKQRVTDYIFDEILETNSEFILYSDNIINIYDKNTGEKIFEYNSEGKGETFKFTTDYFYIKKNNKLWLYTTRGKIFSKKPFDNLYIPDNYKHLRRIIVYKDNKQGVYSFEGEKIVACEYNGIKLFQNAIEAYLKSEKKVTLVYSLSGVLIFTATNYDEEWWSTPAGIVKRNSNCKCGLYSINGKTILPESYDEIEISDMFECNKLKCVRVKRDGKYGVVDFYGNEILPIEFDNIRISEGIPHSHRDFILVKKDSKYGIYSSDGTLQIPIEYEYFKSYFKDTFCNACKDGKWGYYIIPKKQFVIAHEINITKTGVYEIFVDGKWEILDI